MNNYDYNLRIIARGGGSPQARYHDELCPICNGDYEEEESEENEEVMENEKI